MTTHRSKAVADSAVVMACAALCVAVPLVQAQEPARDVSDIPKAVMETLTTRFPSAVIHQWTREEEDGLVLYDIEFTQQGRKFEADVIEDGRIHNWERAITAQDLPERVVAVVTSDYTGATMQEIMAVTAVDDGQEALEGYEIVLETADGKVLEIMVAPDGTVLEEGTP